MAPPHIVSFLLVDRISEFAPGAAARGHLRPPAGRAGLPPCLLVEAVGQLAAYVAMEWADFASRSVAATAGEVRVLADALPDCELDLEIEVISARSVAVGYRGRCSQRGTPILAIERAVGALLPMAEFDDAVRVRRELETLRGEGLPARSIADPAALRNAEVREISASRLRAEITAPLTASFYADHFPRRPVYPATLLLDAQLGLAAELLQSDARSVPRLEVVRHVKVRAFTPPGGRLAVEVERNATEDGRARVDLRAASAAERVSSAVAEFVIDG